MAYHGDLVHQAAEHGQAVDVRVDHGHRGRCLPDGPGRAPWAWPSRSALARSERGRYPKLDALGKVLLSQVEGGLLERGVGTAGEL